MEITRYEDSKGTGLKKKTLRALEQIAMKASYTLEERGGIEGRYNDTEDFPEVGIASIQKMLEEAYKLGLLQRTYVPVSPQNIFEKLAACQPLDSDEYREIEDRVVLSFREDIDQLEDLLDGSQG